jgi:GT2 family glycosyltransferase
MTNAIVMNTDNIENKADLSVVILTYKRQDELLRTLANVARVDSHNIEVIVVNNNPDDTGQILSKIYPQVRYIDTGANIGCKARNIGVSSASAEIVVTIDNDVHMISDHFVDNIIKFFKRHEQAGCVNFKVLRPDGELSLRDWCHPRDHRKWCDTEFQTDHISEGASAFRKEAFNKTGGYFAPFFIGHEGPDLVFRLMKIGYEIWYTPAVETLHYASSDARPNWRAYYYNTRNNIWLAYRHFPAIYAFRYIIIYSAMMFFYAIKANQISAFCKGIKDGFQYLTNLDRIPLWKKSMTNLYNIHAYRPSLLSNFLKHLRSGQTYR